ncbi:MAG: PHP domain-containing protein [Thermotogae bacterium]|jgi:predicted metal-dependent phosphoesterase TrpH|nr:PHP domain-containing protein [Thermotogota bacterium]
MFRRVDLHFHSNHSDGAFPVRDVLEIVAGGGVVFGALTDHDSISGVKEALDLSSEIGIKLIAGVEISTMYDDGEVHILGYDFDPDDAGFNDFLEARFEERTQKVRETVNKLNELGYKITFDDVMEQSPGPFVGRPNVARALLEKGYVKSFKDAFTPELIGDKGKAYVAPKGLDPEEAIKRIHMAEGWAVLAHPGLYKNKVKSGLEEIDLMKMIEWGLDGIEAYHSQHTSAQSKYYHEMARIHGLKITVGTDYHEGTYPIEIMNVPREIVIELLKMVR